MFNLKEDQDFLREAIRLQSTIMDFGTHLKSYKKNFTVKIYLRDLIDSDIFKIHNNQINIHISNNIIDFDCNVYSDSLKVRIEPYDIDFIKKANQTFNGIILHDSSGNDCFLITVNGKPKSISRNSIRKIMGLEIPDNYLDWTNDDYLMIKMAL